MSIEYGRANPLVLASSRTSVNSWPWSRTICAANRRMTALFERCSAICPISVSAMLASAAWIKKDLSSAPRSAGIDCGGVCAAGGVVVCVNAPNAHVTTDIVMESKCPRILGFCMGRLPRTERLDAVDCYRLAARRQFGPGRDCAEIVTFGPPRSRGCQFADHA